MNTLKLTAIALCMLVTAAVQAQEQDMDRTLDRAITLAQAQAMAKPAPKVVKTVLAPVAGVLTAVCNDGMSYYHLTGEHRGACAGHGGVAAWSDGSPVKSKARKTSYR